MKFYLKYKRCIIIASILIVLVGIPCICWLYLRSMEDCSGWYSQDWAYRRVITIEDPISAQTDEDILVEIDTASLISNGKLQSDCDDLRFVDSDDTTLLSFWIEGGCNTSNTQIWVRVPSIPIGGKDIYVYYNNGSATNIEQSWTGKFYTMTDTSCPSGWTLESGSGGDFYQRFPLASDTFGTTGGSSSHDHGSYNITTQDEDQSHSSVGRKEGASASEAGHTHNLTLTTNSTSILPSYLDMLFCSTNDLVLKNDTVSIYTSSTLPTNVTRFSALDSLFPRGNSSYTGTSGGSDTHSHVRQAAVTSTDSTSGTCPVGTEARAATPHTHDLAVGATNPASNLPLYTTVIYGQADADISASEQVITMANAIPPFGWTRYSALDSYFPYGSATYGTTGGAETHSHMIYGSTENGTSAVYCADVTPKANKPFSYHDHYFSISTNTYSNNPPYITTLFIQKIDSFATTVGSEQSDGGNTAPSFTAFNNNGPVNPGSSITFTATASDDDNENIFLVVCKTQGVTGTTCDGGSSDTYCTSSSVLTNPSCVYTEESVKADTTYDAYPYIFDINDTESGSSLQGTLSSYTVSNVAPVVSAVTLNGGSAITLEESTTKDVTITATVTDNNSCYGTEISTVYAYAYRSGIGYTACDTSGEANNNHCYPEISCTVQPSTCTGDTDASADYTCTVSLQYFTDPTDDNTQYPTENWLTTVKATDDNTSSNNSEVSTGVELNSLVAFNVTTAVDFGPLAIGQSNDPLDRTTVITPTGNVALDHELSGPAYMCTDYPACSGATIAIGNQRYALSSSTAYSSATSLTTTPVEEETDVEKPTATSPTTKSIWWGMFVPTQTSPGTYNSIISITGVKGEPAPVNLSILTPESLQIATTVFATEAPLYNSCTFGGLGGQNTTASAIFKHEDSSEEGIYYEFYFSNSSLQTEFGDERGTFSTAVPVNTRSESVNIFGPALFHNSVILTEGTTSEVKIRMWDSAENVSGWSSPVIISCGMGGS